MADESVVVESVCHVGIAGRFRLLVAYAAVMSSLERSISSSTNPEYSCSPSLQPVVGGWVVGMVVGCPCASLPGTVVSCRFCDKPVCSGSCTVCGCTGVAGVEGSAPDDVMLPIAARFATDCRVSPGGQFRDSVRLEEQFLHLSFDSPLMVAHRRQTPRANLAVQFWQKKESGNAEESAPCSMQVQQRPGNSAVCAGGRRELLARAEGSVPDDALLLLLLLLTSPIAAEFKAECRVSAGGPLLFPVVVWFLVDVSSTSSIGVSSILCRTSTLSLAAPVETTLMRFLRVHSHLSMVVKHPGQICSSGFCRLFVVPAPVGAIPLFLSSVSLSAMAATELRSDGRWMTRTWTEMP